MKQYLLMTDMMIGMMKNESNERQLSKPKHTGMLFYMSLL